MTIISRQAESILREKAGYYSIIAITGPRQAGKSTLAKKMFADKPYCSLEDLDQRRYATEDPRGFLSQYPNGAILDEIQHCPDLFSYLQTLVDANPQRGLFVLTGSQQFGLTQSITQSLAGRVGFIQLLPFTINELKNGNYLPDTIETTLFSGSYPPIYDRQIPAQTWYSDYVMTYVERDARQLLNVQDLRSFHRFLQVCAARTGQLLNLSSLATDCGITHNTAKAWISVLEASYIIFLVSPHFRNFNKRLIKSPKLYFYDTGLACLLSGIQDPKQLFTHSMRGALFETFVMSEMMKNRFNKGLLSNLYFWRDSQGHEVDMLIESGDNITPVEIKSGQTITSDFMAGLQYYRDLSKQSEQAWLIYAGEQNRKYQKNNVHVVGWRNMDEIPIN